MKKYFFSLLAIFLILLNVTICNAFLKATNISTVQNKIEVGYADNAFIGPLDLHKSKLDKIFQIYKPLFYSASGPIKPAVGKSYQWIDDTTLEVVLNQNAYFKITNEKVIADDVLKSFQITKKYLPFINVWKHIKSIYKTSNDTIIFKITANTSKSIADQILFNTLIVPQKFSTLFLNAKLNLAKDASALVKPDVTIITEVKPLGQVVVGLAIEYQENISADEVDKETYEVTANRINELGGEIFSRTIINVYTNDKPTFTEKPTSGKYVIIELYDNDINASTFYYGPKDEFNHLYTLEYIVNQKKNIQASNNIIIPANIITGEKVSNLVKDSFLDLQYKDKSGKVLPYRLYVPAYSNSKYYPLVLFLHGSGESGIDNQIQLMANKGAIVWAEDAVQSKHSCFVLAPQCPQTSTWSDYEYPYKASPYLNMVYDLILDLEKKYKNIDVNRIYSTGLSMGGFGTWTINMEHPNSFAAMVPICGGGDPTKANLLVNKPIWVFHAEDDPTVDVSLARDMVNALRKLGSDVKYTEYDKGVVAPPLAPFAHFSWVPAYNDQNMIEWLFLQQKK